MIVYQVRIDPDKPDMSVWTDRDEAVEWAKADWKERCGEGDYEPVENEDFLIESLIVNLPEWRSIDSAPKSGAPILLWWQRCKHPAIGRWVDDETGTGWMSEGDQCMPKNQNDCTHWQPLPQPPKTGDEDND